MTKWIITLILLLMLSPDGTAKTIIKETMSEAERYEALKYFFKPAPGEFVSVSEGEVEKIGRSKPLDVRAFITVAPPKDACFTITRNIELADDRICYPNSRVLSFMIKQIDPGGNITWKISTGENDFGYDYIWKTPHRIAQIIETQVPAEDPKKMTKLHDEEPIYKCTAHINPPNRRIQLDLVSGKTWIINFPAIDIEMDQPPDPPNLFVGKKLNSGGLSADSTLDSEQKARSKSNQGLSGDPVTRHWAIPNRRSYKMNSANFKDSTQAPGMNGTCRYSFTGTEHNSTDGWIECHNTANLDVVFTYLSCSYLLAPNQK